MPSALVEEHMQALQERIVRCLIGWQELTPTPACVPAQVGDFDLDPRTEQAPRLTPAAVLVPIVVRPTGFTVLLTQRTQHLKDHPGQISFPGGRVEATDENPIATALRETQEEIGLPRHCVDIIGHLDIYETATGFLVTPVVGFVQPIFRLKIDPFEVAEVFEVPLPFLLDTRNHQIGKLMFCGKQRRFWVFQYENRFIWGATAGMLMNLFRRLDHALED
ncbi:MAG: CoA pyrophosphatase [Gammaproteobacteria bacterium]